MRKELVTVVLAITFLAAGRGEITVSPKGDGFAGSGEFVTFFSDEKLRIEVQRELGLTSTQVHTAADIAEKFRTEVKRLHGSGALGLSTRDRDLLVKKANAQIKEVLDKEQLGKLQRLSRLQKGADALLNEEVLIELGINSKQEEALAKVKEAADKHLQQQLDQLPRVTGEYVRQIRLSANENKELQMLLILEPAQKQKWEKLKKADQQTSN